MTRHEGLSRKAEAQHAAACLASLQTFAHLIYCAATTEQLPADGSWVVRMRPDVHDWYLDALWGVMSYRPNVEGRPLIMGYPVSRAGTPIVGEFEIAPRSVVEGFKGGLD